MNTALNFVSMPKDSTSSVLSGDLSPDKPGQMAIDSSEKRQGLADGGEKNASFANVLKEESHQEQGQQGTEGKSEQSVKTDNSDSKAVDAESMETQAADTAEADGTAIVVGEEETEESIREARNTGEIILSELKTHIQPGSQTETVSALNTRDSIAEASTDRTSGGEQLIAEEQTNLKATTDDVTKSGISASASVEINSDKTANVAELALKADKPQQPSLATTLQVSSTSNAQPAAAPGGGEETQPGQPLALTAEQMQAKATVQQNTIEVVKQATSGTQPAAQSEEALASSELKESQTKANSISVSASLESLPAAGKPLPNSGKNLPAGLFFQSEGEAPVVSRAEQAAQPIDLNTAIAAKANPAVQQNLDKGMELNGDKFMRNSPSAGSASPEATVPLASATLSTDEVSGNKFMRNLLSAGSASPEAAAPLASAPLSTDNAANTPPLLNPLLQVTADKSLQAARSPLAGSAESALHLNITSQAGSAEWQSQLSGRIRWMGNLNISSAELKLHPAELGAVEIKISTEDDQTRISFITNNAAAKEVIESTLPRLRELLSEGGLNLEQGDVAQRDLSEEKQAHEALNSANQTDNEDDEDAELQQASLHIKRNSTSQIDHYV